LSVSSPFVTSSLQLAAWQVSFSHRPLAQSESSEQSEPFEHPASQGPPQSTPNSSPFSTPSEQLGSAHTVSPSSSLL
jgi:hypothetical protein